ANGIAQGVNASTVENCIQQGVGCLGPWGNTASCLWSFLRCKCPGDLSLNWAKSCVQNALGGHAEKFQRKDASVGLGLSPVDARDVYAARSFYNLELIRLLLGDTDGRWFPSGSGGALGTWFTGFTQSMQSNSPAGTLISPQEAASLLALSRP